MRYLPLALSLVVLPSVNWAFVCPRVPSAQSIVAETIEDCPWAGIARLVEESGGRGAEPAILAYAPDLMRQFAVDRGDNILKQLWGESLNFDEGARAVIVNPQMLSYLSYALALPEPRGNQVHAGLEHTYGYLFSLLETRYGFKRGRWVRPDVEEGLNLPKRVLSPFPSEGTLLSNVTCLAGAIALKDDPKAYAMLKAREPVCHTAIKGLLDRGQAHVRLKETMVFAGGKRLVSLRTDFVPFSRVAASGNSHLLIYSVYDSYAGQAYLITAFPVSGEFVNRALSPGGLGDGKEIITRYNAFVPGITGARKIYGKREVLQYQR